MKSVVLKPGKDKAVRNRHHWIFSGAIQTLPAFENGSVLPVRSADGDILGHAYFNRDSSIAGRMVSFGKTAPEDAIRQNVERALDLRRQLFDPTVTNARRLINAEGDLIPGMIADLYDDVLVLQVATLGMEKLKPLLLELLVKGIKPGACMKNPTFRPAGKKGCRISRGRSTEKKWTGSGYSKRDCLSG